MAKRVFIIGSKGIPAQYGGFETFIEKLTEKRKNTDIQYYVSCMSENDLEFEHNGAKCFNVKVPNIGSAKAVLYDLLSLYWCIRFIKKNRENDCIIYVLACRIGPFLRFLKPIMKKYNINFYVNPDGHEWKRSKWNWWVKKYWKFSEKLMVKYADLLICDSLAIEEYIKTNYQRYHPATNYISYGADLTPSQLSDKDSKVVDWFDKNNIAFNNYYLVVGRFVPENNYLLFIKEFMASNTKKDLVIITNYEQNSFSKELLKETGFDRDSRIKFVGTVYDEELLKKIREKAFAYIHGHEVGGTNPSLLEALASTKLNLLLDVSFNREVGQEGASYFSKEPNSLRELIESLEKYPEPMIKQLGMRARTRVQTDYSWEKIISMYEDLFIQPIHN